MAISMGGGGEETPMSDINTTPLVDVMLVLLIIFLIAIPVAIQTIKNLNVPILVTEESENKVENVLLSVTTTDSAGLNPGQPNYAGASRDGECRVYFNNVVPMDSQQLYDEAFKRLDAIVKRAGGVENMDVEDIPEVHLRADVEAPWKCVGGAIYQMQTAGYPTVGFISNPVDPGV